MERPHRPYPRAPYPRQKRFSRTGSLWPEMAPGDQAAKVTFTYRHQAEPTRDLRPACNRVLPRTWEDERYNQSTNMFERDRLQEDGIVERVAHSECYTRKERRNGASV